MGRILAISCQGSPDNTPRQRYGLATNANRSCLMSGDRMRSSSQALVAGACAGAMLAAAGSALAVDSSWKNFTSNSVSYRNQASMFTNGHALTTLQRLDHGQAPVGRMGGKARAFFSTGTLCGASVTRYNSAPTAIFTIEQPMACGNYLYAQGQTFTWHNNDYKVVDTYRTPNVYTGPE